MDRIGKKLVTLMIDEAVTPWYVRTELVALCMEAASAARSEVEAVIEALITDGVLRAGQEPVTQGLIALVNRRLVYR